MACHHCLWAAQTVERRRALLAIIAFVQHTQSNDVGRGMPSSPLGSTQDRTMSGIACHRRLWEEHTVGRRGAWHDITAIGQHTRSNDVVCDIPSPPFDNTLGKTTSGVACHHHFRQHTRSNDVGRVMTSPPLDSTHGRTMSGVS